MAHSILAFDPGQTTGFTELQLSEDGMDFSVLRCEEIPWDNHVQHMNQIFGEGVKDAVVVVENFRLFPHKALPQIGSQFPSVRVIGTIDVFCWLRGLNIEFQEPGDIARVAVLERDIPKVAGSPHKIDAYRHARLYFIKHYTLNPFSKA